MDDKQDVVVTQKNDSKFGFLKFIGALVAICAAVIAAIKIIDSIKSKRFESKNKNNKIKEYTAMFGCKVIKCSEELEGCFIRSIAGVMNLDLSEAVLSSESFISLSSNLSCLNIIVPENVKVKFDGLFVASRVKDETDDAADDAPILYIAARSNLSCINISRVGCDL